MVKPPSCTGCPYYERPGPVWGMGSPRAKVAFIGSGPGDKDTQHDQYGEPVGPFSGGDGNILRRAASRAGIQVHEQFRTNIVKCKISSGEQPHWKAIKLCRPLLRKELDGLEHLKVIATLGEPAFRAFTGKNVSTVTNKEKGKTPKKAWMRGAVYHESAKPIIPLMHPYYYARTGFITSYEFDSDMEKVARYANGQGRTYTVKSNYSPSANEVTDLVREIRGNGQCGIDIETPYTLDEEELAAGGDTQVDVIGLAPYIGEVVGVPPDLFPVLATLFEDPQHRVKHYVFNGSFDFYHLGKLFRINPSAVTMFDAMIALNIWRSDLQKCDLGALMSFFTDMPYTKNLMETQPDYYNWADTTGVLEGGINIEETLTVQGLIHVLWELDQPLIYDVIGRHPDGLNRMREIGIHADLRETLRLSKVAEQMLTKYNRLWYKKFPMVSWTSPKQLLELFTGPLKMPTQYLRTVSKEGGQRTVKKRPTCNADALKLYRDEYKNPAAKLVLAMREMKHLQDFAGIVNPHTKHIHTAYMIHRQVQRRLQAKEPNIQQLPEKLGDFYTRKIAIPDDPDNDVIMAVDFSQIELRIYVERSGAVALKRAMDADIYIYGFMYEQIYGKSFFKPGGTTKYDMADYVEPQEILAAKSGPLGFIYGRGADSLTEKHGMPKAQSRAVHKQFHRENPEIGIHHDRRYGDAKRDSYLDNAWGARRYFPSPKVQYNEILSFDGQSNGAEVLRQNLLIPCFRNLHRWGARMLFSVHDSAGINCPKQHVEEVSRFIRDVAQAPIPQLNGLVIPIEIKVGPNWADAKAIEVA